VLAPDDLQVVPGESATLPRKLIGYKSQTAFHRIVDGTSKTLLCGEVSKLMAEHTHAFNGNFRSGVFVGEKSQFAPNPEPSDPPDNYFDTIGFGSSHPGVIHVALVDGSVQGLNKTIDPAVLDRMAWRNDGEAYQIDGTLPTCILTSGPVGP
jgi:hypothetical protein